MARVLMAIGSFGRPARVVAAAAPFMPAGRPPPQDAMSLEDGNAGRVSSDI
jgi:hypothetical protein